MPRKSAVASSQWLETGHSASAWENAYLTQNADGSYGVSTAGPAEAWLAPDPNDLSDPTALTLHTGAEPADAVTLIRQPTSGVLLFY